MIQQLLYEPIVYYWGISVMIHPLYWMLFSHGSKLEGIGLRFFDTAVRSIILSETIGLGGTIISIMLAPENTLTLILLALWVTPLIVVSVYMSQRLRYTIESRQSLISSENKEHTDPSDCQLD